MPREIEGIPLDEVAAVVAEKKAAREDKRFDEEFLRQCQFSPESETPQEFIERLKNLFPHKAQKDFLEVFWQAARLVDMAMITSSHMDNGIALTERQKAFFPPELNPAEQRNSQEPTIVMATDRAIQNELIVATNVAILSIQQYEKDILEPIQAAIKEILQKGKSEQLELPLIARIALFKNMFVPLLKRLFNMGTNDTSLAIDSVLAREVTSEKLGYSFGRMLYKLKELQKLINAPFDVMTAIVQVLELSYDATDLSIPAEALLQIQSASRTLIEL